VDVAIAGTEAPDAIPSLPLLGPAHPPGSSPQPARKAGQPAAGRHQPGRACADHPDRLSQCLDRQRADGSAERRQCAPRTRPGPITQRGRYAPRQGFRAPTIRFLAPRRS
jgi:hypothetical protein